MQPKVMGIVIILFFVFELLYARSKLRSSTPTHYSLVKQNTKKSIKALG